MKRLLPILMLLLGIGGCTSYDHETADTPANRKGFVHHLHQQPSADVKGIYYYADEIGADCSYQLRFECSQETHDSLVQSLGLDNTELKEGHFHGREFPWWDPQVVYWLPVHWRINAKGDYFRFLWYDAAKGEAFYLEYSI